MKTAEEILGDYGCALHEVPFDENVTMFYPSIIEAMKEYAQEALREASEKAKINYKWKDGVVKEGNLLWEIDKNSIIKIELL